MCIFYSKSLNCGCLIIAWHFRKDGNTIILTGHDYKRFCNKCVNLSDNELDNRLNNFKKNNYKLYSKEDSVLYSNGWKNTTDYTVPNKHLEFGVDYY
jgi:hypothetical protein